MLSEISDGIEQARRYVSLSGLEPQARPDALARLKVNLLVCGAIAWPTEAALTAKGIRVISHIRGDVDRVLAALLSQRLDDDAFLMPGCREHGFGYRHRRGRGRPSQ